MNPLKIVTRPARDLARAVILPFQAVFVVGLCWVINAMTYQGTWWVKWVALGMGIAVVVALARAARSLLVLALVAWVGHQLYKRWGPQARAVFEQWVQRTRPEAADVFAVWRDGRVPGSEPLRH